MRFFAVCCSLFAAMLPVFPAHAAAPFVELERTGGFHAEGAPADAVKLIKQVAADPNTELKCFAFTTDADWVFQFGGSGYYSSNTNLPACKKMTELWKSNADFKCLAFSPDGGWTLLWDRNGSWTEGKVPDATFKKIAELGKAGSQFRWIAYGPKDAWVLAYDKSSITYGNLPDDLRDVLRKSASKHVAVRCVAFSGKDWICLTDDGWSTSDVTLPASKYLDSSIKAGRSPHWIALEPAAGPHDFERWAQIIHQSYDGKLAGGYAFEVYHLGKHAAGGAGGWARAPFEKEHPSVKFTVDKPMGVASVSKTVTAVALLKLWEERNHEFDLDAPFWPHLKKAYPHADPSVKQVTIRQLLTHTSGFDPKIDAHTPDILKKLLAAPLILKPGEHEEYENSNFYVCRVLIEQIGNVSYTPYVKQHVLQPMGITRMETHFDPNEPTCGYLKANDKRPGYPFDWNQAVEAGAAGWYASATDLGRFLLGIRDNKVLSPATHAMMFKDKLGWDSSHPCMMKNGGWSWDEGMGGRAGDLHSVIAHFPDDIDAVILSNCTPPISVEELVVKAWRESR